MAAAAVMAMLGLASCAVQPLVGEGLHTRAPSAATQQSATPSPSASHPSAPPSSRPSAPPSRGAEPGGAAREETTFVGVVDGDTIDTAAGRVRIIGIDTPERHECGHEEASMAIGRVVAPGAPVTLELPDGQNDTDHYERLLRTVTTSDGVDLGLMQLEAGHAIARYDSRDGYPSHPREASYHAAQTATQGPNRTVVTTGCQESGLAPPPVAAPGGGERWWEQYSSCTKLKKSGSGHPTGPFSRFDPAEAAIYEWFAFGTGNRGDGDGDGLACE